MDGRLRLYLETFIVGLVAAGLAFGLACMVTRPPRKAAPSARAMAPLARLGQLARLSSHNASDFESGNIGGIDHTKPTEVRLHLRSDNDDALPKYWRQWFYARIDDMPTDRSTTVTLDGAGMWSYYLPYYSYDNVNWHQFTEREVKQPTKFTLAMTHRFERKTVWVARYVPYTYTRLKNFLSGIKKHPDVVITDIGPTPAGNPLPLITITSGISSAAKPRVMIHARTHPGEVGSSFLLEGLIKYLLSSNATARRMREHLIFTIVPMLNVDGVIAGNNRVSPMGINLEGKWYPSPGSQSSTLAVDNQRVPPEVRLLHDHVVALLHQKNPVSMALNLHASAGEPRDNVFIFPHFGPESLGYDPAEARLYAKQVRFIADLGAIQGSDWLNIPPAEGTRAFLAKSVPETWWWRNFRDQVMALTLESTYGFAGKSNHWVQPDDMRRFGASVGRAIARYHGLERAH